MLAWAPRTVSSTAPGSLPWALARLAAWCMASSQACSSSAISAGDGAGAALSATSGRVHDLAGAGGVAARRRVGPVVGTLVVAVLRIAVAGPVGIIVGAGVIGSAGIIVVAGVVGSAGIIVAAGAGGGL